MIQEIKNLRVKIDGLAQLTKGLKPQTKWVMDLAYLPKDIGIDMDKWMEIFETKGYALVDSTGKIEEGIKNGFREIHTKDKEIEKAYDSLILAKAWLGKVLGELGTDSPYKSGYKEVSDIEPTADISTPKIWHLETHIEKVDYLRIEIDNLHTEIWNLALGKDEWFERLIENPKKYNTKYYHSIVCQHLSEARFHLGFELQRIKEQSDKQ